MDPDDEIDSGSDEEGGSLANSVEEAGSLTQVGVLYNHVPSSPSQLLSLIFLLSVPMLYKTGYIGMLTSHVC